jgi:hypothetical protein
MSYRINEKVVIITKMILYRLALSFSETIVSFYFPTSQHQLRSLLMKYIDDTDSTLGRQNFKMIGL